MRCRLSAQELYDLGYLEREYDMMLHRRGQIVGLKKDMAVVSYAEYCDYDAGYKPIVVNIEVKYLREG